MTTIYVDILIALNWFINYFLFLAVSAFTRYPLKNRRNLLASFVLAFGSLIILLPTLPFPLGLLIRLAMAAVGVLMAFGFRNTRVFLRLIGSFFAATFAFGGVFSALEYLLEPGGLLVHNSVVYYNVSPLLVVSATLVSYGVLWLLKKNFGKAPGQCEFAGLHLNHKGKTVTLQARVDTGFLLTDLYGNRPLIMVSPKMAARFLNLQNPTVFLLPYQTVHGAGLVECHLCDRLRVEYNRKTACFENVLVAIAKEELNDGFDGLIGTDLIERMEWNVSKNQTNTLEPLAKTNRRANRLHQRAFYPSGTSLQTRRTGTYGTAETGGHHGAGEPDYPQSSAGGIHSKKI